MDGGRYKVYDISIVSNTDCYERYIYWYIILEGLSILYKELDIGLYPRCIMIFCYLIKTLLLVQIYDIQSIEYNQFNGEVAFSHLVADSEILDKFVNAVVVWTIVTPFREKLLSNFFEWKE